MDIEIFITLFINPLNSNEQSEKVSYIRRLFVSFTKPHRLTNIRSLLTRHEKTRYFYALLYTDHNHIIKLRTWLSPKYPLDS